MPKTLPENATPASRRLYDLAVRLAESCPPDMASEIALVGSAAMGLSDDKSDLDINFWSETLPPEADRVAWLESMGATDVKVGRRRSDYSYPCAGVLAGIDVGCSWQTFNTLNFFTELIAQGNWAFGEDIPLQILTDVYVQALPIRTTGKVEAAQKRLEHYPIRLGEKTILQSVNGLDFQFKQIGKSLRYKDELSLVMQLSVITRQVIDLLYPINRRYSPQAKWKYQLAGDLPLKPPNLYERIGLALHDPDLRQRPIHLARLMLDTLALVQDEYDVSAAVNTIQAVLSENE